MRWLVTLAAFSMAVVASQAAGADQLQDIKSRGKLICGTLGTFEPFSFQDPATREIIGYDVDFCRAVATAIGVPLEVKPIAVEARIPELIQGRVDIVSAAMGYSDARAQQIGYSKTYFVSRQRILVRADAGIANWDQLADKKVSAIKGSDTEAFIRQLIPKAQTVTFQDPATAFLALQQGKVDGTCASEIALSKAADAAGGGFTLLARPIVVERWGLAIRKEETGFIAYVNSVLDKMESSGDGKAVFDKWFGPATRYKLERSFTFDAIGNPVIGPAS